jgi:PAS domain S-box-containing protein
MVNMNVGDGLSLTEGSQAPELHASDPHLLEALIRSSGELFAVLDAEGVIKFIDGSLEIRLGTGPGFLVGSNVFDLLQHSDFERAGTLWAQRVSTKETMPAADFWVERPNGTWLCLNLVLNNLLDDPAVRGILVTARDVTDRVNLERARVSVSAANSALVHASTEADLFDRLCRVVVNDVTYHLAWIGLTDPSKFLGVRMVAFADHSAAYVDALEALAGTETYQGPIAIAFKTRELQVVQDLAAMTEPSAWQRLALLHGYRSVIALPLFLDEDDFGVLAIYSEWTNVFTSDAIAVLSELSGDLSYGIKNLRNKVEQSALQLRFQGSLEAAVTAIATASELRDPYTAGHQHRVGELACAIATEMGVEAEVIAGIQVAATIHDVGKLIVPAEILSSPGRLKEAEFALIKQHPQAGYDIVSGIEFPWPVPEMVLQHHERLDGSGYPNGLRGEEIAMGARIIAVADTVEAITSHRPYRPALGLEVAIKVISDGRGTLFDPEVVDACCLLFAENRFSFSP